MTIREQIDHRIRQEHLFIQYADDKLDDEDISNELRNALNLCVKSSRNYIQRMESLIITSNIREVV